MSKHEKKRREICSKVMHYAWRLYKKGGGWLYKFSNCLKMAWKHIRGVGILKRTNVVGVTYESIGGVNRQSILSTLLSFPRETISLYLKREVNNLYDSDAILVVARIRDGNGNNMDADVGYINRREASILAPRMDAGNRVVAILEEIVGGGEWNYGMRIAYALLP